MVTTGFFNVVCFSNEKKMTCRLISLVLFLSSLVINVLGNLEQVNDVELEKLIANEKFVITLFRDGKVYFYVPRAIGDHVTFLLIRFRKLSGL
jgi:hypothetical protein